LEIIKTHVGKAIGLVVFALTTAILAWLGLKK